MIDGGQIRGAVGPNVTCVLSYEFRDGTTYTNNIEYSVRFHKQQNSISLSEEKSEKKLVQAAPSGLCPV